MIFGAAGKRLEAARREISATISAGDPKQTMILLRSWGNKLNGNVGKQATVGALWSTFSCVPLAAFWTIATAILGSPDVTGLILVFPFYLFVGFFMTFVGSFVIGLPLVLALSKIRAVTAFSVISSGTLLGIAIFLSWQIYPVANDPMVTESWIEILAESLDFLVAFALSGAFAGSTFWVGMTKFQD